MLARRYPTEFKNGLYLSFLISLLYLIFLQSRAVWPHWRCEGRERALHARHPLSVLPRGDVTEKDGPTYNALAIQFVVIVHGRDDPAVDKIWARLKQGHFYFVQTITDCGCNIMEIYNLAWSQTPGKCRLSLTDAAENGRINNIEFLDLKLRFSTLLIVAQNCPSLSRDEGPRYPDVCRGLLALPNMDTDLPIVEAMSNRCTFDIISLICHSCAGPGLAADPFNRCFAAAYVTSLRLQLLSFLRHTYLCFWYLATALFY
jgi:hypothetical protein